MCFIFNDNLSIISLIRYGNTIDSMNLSNRVSNITAIIIYLTLFSHLNKKFIKNASLHYILL